MGLRVKWAILNYFDQVIRREIKPLECSQLQEHSQFPHRFSGKILYAPIFVPPKKFIHLDHQTGTVLKKISE